MDKCEKCGFLECRCFGRVVRDCVFKYKFLELVGEMRAEIHSKGCGCNGCEMLREYAGKFEKLLRGE